MVKVYVQDIVQAVSGKLCSGDPKIQIKNITTDSRSVLPDTLFVPIVGENMDGHRFIGSAFQNGALGTLTENPGDYEKWISENPDSDKIFIVVKNTTEAMQQIGRLARTHLSMPAVGVTGSVGKTTTREMITAALQAEKKVYRTSKNFNNWLGVPISLCEIEEDNEIAVLELGMNVPGELGLISSLTDLDCGVITNIGVAHMEFYGSQDGIAKEKFTITKGFWPESSKSKLLVLNVDDEYLMKYKDSTGFPYVTYGTSDEAMYKAENVHQEQGQYVFDFVLKGEKMFPVTLSVLGEHNVLNALAALAVCDYFKVDLQKAAESLRSFNGFKGRLQRFEKDGYLIIDDTYNANPVSMKAGIDVLCNVKYGNGEGRKIAVLGDMFELGEEAPKYHYEVGCHLASKEIDLIILIGENAMEMKRAVEERAPFKNIMTFASRESILEELKKSLGPNDVVYLKASNGMKLYEIAEGLLKDE